jgi:hypothetical protein
MELPRGRQQAVFAGVAGAQPDGQTDALVVRIVFA